MKNFTSILVTLGIIFLQSTCFAQADFEKELEFECGSDKICRTALREQRERDDEIDLMLLEEKILADGGEMKSEPVAEKAKATVEKQPEGERGGRGPLQVIVKRPPRPSGPRP